MSALFDRWCARGQYFCKPDSFRPAKTKHGPGLARDCIPCEQEASRRAKEINARQSGVDIDRIHRLPPRFWEKPA